MRSGQALLPFRTDSLFIAFPEGCSCVAEKNHFNFMLNFPTCIDTIGPCRRPNAKSFSRLLLTLSRRCCWKWFKRSG